MYSASFLKSIGVGALVVPRRDEHHGLGPDERGRCRDALLADNKQQFKLTGSDLNEVVVSSTTTDAATGLPMSTAAAVSRDRRVERPCHGERRPTGRSCSRAAASTPTCRQQPGPASEEGGPRRRAGGRSARQPEAYQADRRARREGRRGRHDDPQRWRHLDQADRGPARLGAGQRRGAPRLGRGDSGAWRRPLVARARRRPDRQLPRPTRSRRADSIVATAAAIAHEGGGRPQRHRSRQPTVRVTTCSRCPLRARTTVTGSS